MTVRAQSLPTCLFLSSISIPVNSLSIAGCVTYVHANLPVLWIQAGRGRFDEVEPGREPQPGGDCDLLPIHIHVKLQKYADAIRSERRSVSVWLFFSFPLHIFVSD